MSPPAAATGRQRHFIALLPDDAARARLASLPLPEGAASVSPADLHLTLAFLGTLDEAGEARALGAISGLSPSQVAVRLDRLEHWTRSRVLCATGEAGEVGPLVATLRARLREAGFELEERPFVAHVTLARKAPRGAPRLAPLAEPVGWVSTALALMASGPGAARPRYGLVGQRSLGAPANG